MHALGASGLGYALARRRPGDRAPFVFNPQGLEEFGGTHPGFARLKRLAYTPLQAAVRRCAQAADAILATDHALVAPVRAHLAVDPARIHVVPNAVDLETIDRARASAAADRRDAAGAGSGWPPASGCCSASAGSRRTRASTCWRRRSPSCGRARAAAPAGAGCWSATARIARASPAPSTPPG